MNNEKILVPSYNDLESFNDDLEKIINADYSKPINNDKYFIESLNDKTHINISHFVLCESFGGRVLGLSGYSLSAYRLMSSFAINNFARFNGLFCCFSFHWLAISLNCGISTAKRVIYSLEKKRIIQKIGRGRNGRNCYKVLKTYEFDYFGALLSYYDTLDKKSSKKINLKNKDNKNVNIFGLPSWINYFGNYERFLTNRLINCDEISAIAKIKWVNRQ